MKLVDLRVNQVREMLGYDVSHISFSWKTDDCVNEKKQEQARIRVYSQGTEVFNSGFQKEISSLGYEAPLNVQPRTRYDWIVEICTDQGETIQESSWFETGKMNEPWTAKWLVADLPEEITPVFQKEICLNERPDRARMYFCGLGLYELYINGKKVSDEFLAPGYHSYDLHLQAQTYDVTEYLKEGNNTIRVLTGDGWYKGRIGFRGGYTQVYGEKCCIIGELYITGNNGQETLYITDESWKCAKSPIIFSNMYDGEIYDANKEEIDEWQNTVESVPEKCGHLEDRKSLPVKKMEVIHPVKRIVTPKGEIVFDFGQNLTGWIVFQSKLKKGTEVCFTAGEIMQEECFYRENYRTAKAEFHYISDGTVRQVRPHFTFYGFRYMKVECDEEILMQDVEAWHLRSDFEQRGWIETGNQKVNKLYLNALWGQKDNFLDVPTDCPQRDEKLGWTGDAQIFSGTACYNMDVAAFFAKYMWDMRAEQNEIEGSVPNVVPRLKHGIVAGTGSCPWADAAVVIPWNVYIHYGDKALLREMYPGMKAWLEYQKKHEESLGGKHLVKDGFHFADWLALDNPEPGPLGMTNPLFIASTYYYYCADTVSKAAELLGYEEDAILYHKLSGEILKAINETYFDEKGSCTSKTQTGYAMSIMFGLVEEKKEAEGKKLFEKLKENNGYLNTGFVGTAFLCPALSETGHHRAAVDLLLNEEFPSWLYSVNHGATTIWERWNSVLPNGKMNPEGMNSLNHYSYGSVVEWMYRYLGGIQPVAGTAGFKKILWKPMADERLDHVYVELNTAAGKYVSKWKYTEEQRIIYNLQIPFDCEAEIVLPKGTYLMNDSVRVGNNCCLPTGNYSFVKDKS